MGEILKELTSYLNRIRFFIKKHWFALMILLVGFGLRLMVTLRGNNYDFDSWLIVAEIMASGGNVYAKTERYNYGPVWANILLFLFKLSSENPTTFRYLLVLFLSMVDAGIFTVLYSKYNLKVGSLFFLNPISIIITGYHNQFGNLAILTAMLSILIISDEFQKPFHFRNWLGIFLLGISLMIKHIMFFFPVWLAIKQKGITWKLAYLLIPPIIFFLSFLPFVEEGGQGILDHVFLYQSFKSDLFYRLFFPSIIRDIVPTQILWVGILLCCGFILREKDGFDSLLFYTCAMVATSPAIANQYLAIPLAWVVLHRNIFSILYLSIASWCLLIDSNGLHLDGIKKILNLDSWVSYLILVALLTLSFIWVVWRRYFSGLNDKVIVNFMKRK